uniref:Uncharacterized protein n=1 Tax=Tanacetum cinerariifolium TaxID=118510 RepID=A0A6L2L0T0_TANCI|nr:hypothetical protein [Tanacetum cinerariifolium]
MTPFSFLFKNGVPWVLTDPGGIFQDYTRMEVDKGLAYDFLSSFEAYHGVFVVLIRDLDVAPYGPSVPSLLKLKCFTINPRSGSGQFPCLAALNNVATNDQRVRAMPCFVSANDDLLHGAASYSFIMKGVGS